MFGNLLGSIAQESEFVKEVKYFASPVDPGKASSDFTSEDEQVETLLLEIIEKCKQTEYVTHIYEIIYLSINDIPGLKFTITVGEGHEITLERGVNPDLKPTLELPLYLYNLEFFNSWLDDDGFSEEELHKIVHTLAYPAVKSFYQSDMINKLKHISFLKLHKLIHLQLANPQHFEYEGVYLDGKVTVMNVMGQFFIFPGHHGVAPITYTFTPMEAVKFYDLVKYDLPRAKSMGEKKKLFESYMEMRKKMARTSDKYLHPDNK